MLAASPFCLERRGLVLKIHCPHLPRPVILVRDWDPSQWGSPELHRWSLQFGGNNMSWKQRRSRVTELRTVFISDSFPLTLNRFEQLQATPEKQPENLNFKQSAVWKSEVFQHNWKDVGENSLLPAMRFFGVNWEWHLDRNCADPRGSMKI